MNEQERLEAAERLGHWPQRAGETVRVVLEGRVEGVGQTGFSIGELRPHRNWIKPDAAHVVSVERLPDPEPEWKVGDVVLDGGGRAAEYAPEPAAWPTHPWRRFDGRRVHDSVVPRPLTLLVRDGESYKVEEN